MRNGIGDSPTPRGLYLIHVSIHGLIRANSPEIGIDADTGGQTTYVLELTRRLGNVKGVRRFDLFTRRIIDDGVSDDYARDVESVSSRSQIVRLPCGPDRYLPKENLWPYMQEFIDNALRYIRSQADVPDAIHGHYADGGFAATRIAKVLGIPLIYTAHSLGRFKRERLLSGGMNARSADAKYQFRERIEAEEETLENAECVIASTGNEVVGQYARYDHYNKDAMRILPPGGEIECIRATPSAATIQQFNKMARRFLVDPSKPALITIARPDAQKNTVAALHAFGRSDLRKHANLFLFIGLRTDLATVDPSQRALFMELFELIDLYDLHGSVAYPKHHTPELVGALYRHAAKSGGLFVTLSKHENFGLTLVEAAAAGLPVISSGAGGMSDVLRNCGHGVIVDPNDYDTLALTIMNCLADKTRWLSLSTAGKRNVKLHYSWHRHIKSYLELINQCTRGHAATPHIRRRLQKFNTARDYLVSDIDDTLTGNLRSMRRLAALINKRDDILFGIATGRTLQSAQEIIKECGLPDPTLLITSVGTRIHYNFGKCTEDKNWRQHIQFRWEPSEIRELLDQLNWLEPQETEAQAAEKISYYLSPQSPHAARDIKSLLRKHLLQARVVVSRNRCVDVLPIRASKGHALRYVGWRFGFEMSQFLTAGDAGNDIDMLRGNTRGIVVANHSEEVRVLRRSKDVFFSPLSNAAGVLDGLKHYGVC